MLGQKRLSSASTGASSEAEISPKLRKLLGPAAGDATLCADARDPVSLQEIWRANAAGQREATHEIELLFSYEETHADGKTFVRGFALDSLAQLIERHSDENENAPTHIRHPVSGLPVPEEALARARALMAQQGISGERVDFGTLRVEELSDEKMRFFALEVFQLLATIDVRVDERIFLSLSPERLTRLALETREMLEANLPEFLLEALKPQPAGRPFTPLPKIPSTNSLRQFVLRETRRIFLKTKKVVQTVNAPGQLQLLGYVIVGALATVCPEVRRSFQDSLAFSFELRDFTDDSDDSDAEAAQGDRGGNNSNNRLVAASRSEEDDDSSPSSSSSSSL